MNKATTLEVNVKDLVDFYPQSCLLLSTDGFIIKANDSFQQLSQLDPSNHINLNQWIKEPSQKIDFKKTYAICLTQKFVSFDVNLFFHNDAQTPVNLSFKSISINSEKAQSYFLVAVSDLSREIRLEQELKNKLFLKQKIKKEQLHLESIADNLPALVSSLDASLCYTFYNHTFNVWFEKGDIIGHSMESVLGKSVFLALTPYFQDVLKGRKVIYEHPLSTKQGELYVQTILIPCKPFDSTRFHCFILNITEQKQLQNQYEYEASHDALTGIPNRRTFMKRLDHLLAGKIISTNIAVIFLDIDGFKGINDHWGHNIGDKVLIKTAAIISYFVKKLFIQNGLAARLAGDEFVILLDNLINPENEITQLCTEIINAMKQDIDNIVEIPKVEITFAVSLGAKIIYPETMSNHYHLTSSDALSNADKAMYEAKKMGKGCYVIM